MDAFLTATAASFGVIFTAELGDKSQLMALVFATRFRAFPVLVGITGATAVVHLFSVLLGYGFGAALPTRGISVVAALAFFGFALWTFRGDHLSDVERARAERPVKSVILAVGFSFFLAELGDKTMLATVVLATEREPIGTWLGSTLGMVAADALAIMIGRSFGKRLPESIIRWGAALLFVLFGIALLLDAILS
ncbi:MAG: TMEM165/GDT1 family protein [Actinomycetota bacterium]